MDGALHVPVVDDDQDTPLSVRTVLQRRPSPVPDVAPHRLLPAAVPSTAPAAARPLEDRSLPPGDVLPEEAAR